MFLTKETNAGRGMSSNNVAEALRKVVNSHGYGFHHAVIKAAESLFPDKSPWKFDASEVPVSVRGQDTRIDFVLKHKEKPVYLICECKRANPALNNWCFLRTPYVKRDHRNGALILEGVKYAPDVAAEKRLISDQTSLGSSEFVYGLAMEIRSNEKGDVNGGGRGEIEMAATQVCRGLNGFVEFLSNHPEIITQNQWAGNKAFIVPVIFTTAHVLVSEVDLREVYITDGKLSVDSLEVIEKSWIWYRYHQSPGIKHTMDVTPGLFTNGRLDDYIDVGLVVERNFARTIAMVNATGIESFLAAHWLR